MRIKIKRQIVVLWLIIATIQILTNSFNIFSGEWNFNTPLYYNLFWSIYFCSLVTLFIVPFLNKKTYKFLVVLLITIWFPIIYLQFNPIDTSTFPGDIKVVNNQGVYKQVIRENQNMKTLQFETDTVWVEDKFIFRRIIKNGIQ
jgi:hypothetical protein